MCLRLVSFDESSSLTSRNSLPSWSWLLTNSGHNCWVLRLVNATEVCCVQIQVLHQWLFQERQWWLILSLCEGVPNVLLPCVSSSPVLHCNSFSWRFCSSRSYLKQIWFEILWSSAFQLFLKQLRHQLRREHALCLTGAMTLKRDLDRAHPISCRRSFFRSIAPFVAAWTSDLQVLIWSSVLHSPAQECWHGRCYPLKKPIQVDTR